MATPAYIQTRGSLGDLGKRGLGPQFEDVFDQNLIKYDGRKYAEQLFGFINTDKSVVRTTGLTGYGFLEQFEEGDAFPQTANIKTFETTYTIRDYGQVVTVTDDCLKDREKLQGKFDEMANHAKSADITEVKHAFMILNNGFSSSTNNGGATIYRYNSAALFQASHSRADGGTAQSNYSATGITLTELNLETGRLALVKQLTDNGIPIVDMGRATLCVPDDLEKNAVIFTGSALRPTTANNDINFYVGRINVLSSRWLNSASSGSSTAWFLIAALPGFGKQLRVYRNGGPEFKESPPESKTWNRDFAVKNRYAVGFSTWMGMWASAGA